MLREHQHRIVAATVRGPPRRGYMRALVGWTHWPMVLVTPGAYLQLTGGMIGAADGVQKGYPWLAGLLFVFSLAALYGLWSIWSVSARL
jgi:hypothetical protein